MRPVSTASASTHRPTTRSNNGSTTTQVRITEAGIRLVHAKLRFAFPPELDLMAELAGLTLESRWGSFGRAPFTGDSAFAVSIYRRA